MRWRVGCTALALAGLLLAGCGGSGTDLAASRARTLQDAVLGVTHAAADGRWDDAEALLATTRTELDAGARRGEVSTERYGQIDAALDEVQAELSAQEARAAAAEQERAAAAALEQERAAAEQERAAAEQAVTDQTAPIATVAPAPAPPAPKATTPKGKGDHPGKGKGNK
ncbi:hypothetical protein [Cellulomonas sp. URHE0023]|uniref:hypothetical protein n=1 Tax=Cellulomonas sp. URHE0023 TaxID=1380354 RepID=UPI000483E324|nr:hypothetical protein [Cellulomonas sp. URHE0023]